VVGVSDAPTEETAMSDVTATVDTYLAAWNESDPARRAGLVEQVWAPDGQLIDPPLAAEGHAGISDLHAALQGQFPGHRFRRSSAVDAHHDRLRFGWELVGPDGAVALAGLDVGELAGDGRLRRVVGFFGDLPAA
jgi:SnoaL-like domain